MLSHTIITRNVQHTILIHYSHPTFSLRQEEVAAMSGPDEFGEFYHRLRLIKDYHRKNPNEIEEPMQMEFLRMENERQKPSEEMQSGLQCNLVINPFTDRIV